MNLQPLGNRVLLKRAPTIEVSTGGIYLPQNAIPKSREAEVVALGIGKDEKGRDVSFAVKPGDCVILKDKAGTPVNGQDEYVLAYEHEMLGILEEVP
jgi:chaperonin GroES